MRCSFARTAENKSANVGDNRAATKSVATPMDMASPLRVHRIVMRRLELVEMLNEAKKDTDMSEWNEARMTCNGVELETGLVMTIRVALESYMSFLCD